MVATKGTSFVDDVRKCTPLIVKRSVRTLQSRLRTLWAKYRCPVCNSRVNAFERLPKYYRENQEKYGFPYKPEEAETCNHLGYLCPSCQASDRDRLYALYLRNYFGSLHADGVIKLIDFAPSPPLSDFIRRQIAHSGQAVSYRTADYSGVGVDDRVDITDLRTYADGQFDFFICSHVLEHVTDDRKALRELYRILPPGGQGILMVPIILSLRQIDEDPTIVDEGERWKRFGQDDHVRLYSKDGFLQRVSQAGFSIDQLGQEYFGPVAFRRYGIGERSILFIVKKDD